MVVGDPNQTASLIQNDLDTISQWASDWLVKFNPSKSESMIISKKANKPTHPQVSMLNTVIPPPSRWGLEFTGYLFGRGVRPPQQERRVCRAV